MNDLLMLLGLKEARIALLEAQIAALTGDRVADSAL